MKGTSVPDVYVVADNVLSPIGDTTEDNFRKLLDNVSAIKRHAAPELSAEPFYAAVFDEDRVFLSKSNNYTKFEQLLIRSVSGALGEFEIDVTDDKTILIVSSTKGNISLLEDNPDSPELRRRISLTTSANLVAKYFGFVNEPIVISNACISGVMALITGMRLLRSGQYDTAVVTGADVVSKFIVSGFQSFNALSPAPCKPFDEARDGLNLGEGAAAIILSTDKKYCNNIRIKGGSVSNDANHISGPSRTGKELGYAIEQALKDAGVTPEEIDFVSAHGTATVYNDEMEANAINLAGLKSVPLNSLKGFYGHTLGAAGLIEAAVSLASLKKGVVIPTIGFTKLGVSAPVNVCSMLIQTKISNFLKTASGFGGCNGAVIFGK